MRVGKDGKQRQPGAQKTAEARAGPAELLGAPSSSADLIIQPPSAPAYLDRVNVHLEANYKTAVQLPSLSPG
jgi:hypothetical protein